MVLVDQEVGIHVRQRDVELRIVLPFPDIQGMRGVEHDGVVQQAPHPARGRLDVVDGNEWQRQRPCTYTGSAAAAAPTRTRSSVAATTRSPTAFRAVARGRAASAAAARRNGSRWLGLTMRRAKPNTGQLPGRRCSTTIPQTETTPTLTAISASAHKKAA